jgi:hypothetical protein
MRLIDIDIHQNNKQQLTERMYRLRLKEKVDLGIFVLMIITLF